MGSVGCQNVDWYTANWRKVDCRTGWLDCRMLRVGRTGSRKPVDSSDKHCSVEFDSEKDDFKLRTVAESHGFERVD